MSWNISTFLKTYRTPLLMATFLAIIFGVFAYDLERSDFAKLISLLAALFFIVRHLINTYGWNFWLLASFGLLFRLVFLVAVPNLSQDFYRFLWDGRLLMQGINPYLTTPEVYLQSGNEIVTQAQELYRGMGPLNGSHFSNYPPVNQLFYGIAALFAGKSILGSVIVLRILIILADLGILYFGKKLLEALKLPTANIFWYFLNPFIIIELTGNLHFEGVMLFFLVWSLFLLHKRKLIWASMLWGVSVSIKLIPLLFTPLFYKYFVTDGIFKPGFWRLKKFSWVMLAVIAITFLPFLSSEFIQNFWSTIALWFQSFEFNASIYYVIRWIGYETIGWNIIADVGKILPIVVLSFVLGLSFFRKNSSMQQLVTAMLFAITGYFLLSTTVHPWYIATPLILSVFTKYRFPIVWSFMVMFSYSAYVKEGFNENLFLVAMEYLVVIGFMIWEVYNLPKKTSVKSIV